MPSLLRSIDWAAFLAVAGAVVPAALAIAERVDADGQSLLRAVATGYEIAARINIAMGFSSPAKAKHSTHSIGPAFGAAAAAAALLRLDARQARHMLSYSAQQASGIPFWNRDNEPHFE
jgi:2-methylcitrate dehydratase PrpD